MARRCAAPSCKFNAFSLIGGQMSGDSAHQLYPGVSGGQLGGDRTRHAVPDHRRVGVRQADPGAFARSRRFHAVRLQGGAAGLRRHAPVRRRRRFSDGRDAVLARQLRMVEKRYEQDDLRAISDWWQERMRQACTICRRSGSRPHFRHAYRRSPHYVVPLLFAGLSGASHHPAAAA